jgi:prepilin-type N-terminal cleavage/methylation domain-containing protein
MSARSVGKRSLAAEEGMTMIEVMVAITLLAIGVLAFMQTFIPVQSLNSTSENAAVEASIAEKELEKIAAAGYACIALSGTPTSSTDPNNPGYYMRSGPSLQWDLTNPSRVEPLYVSAGLPTGCTQTLAAWQSAFAPTGSWSSGGKNGTIHRYVTWVDDPLTCAPATATCPTTGDYKRVTLMITHTGRGAPRKPVLLTTIVSNPTAGPGGLG